MGKLIVDQIQKPGGSVFTLPSTAIAGSLTSDASGNLSIVAPLTTPIMVASDSWKIVGSVISGSGRQNLYSTGEWSSSGPNSTYQNATGAGSNATYTHQSWNMALGDGYPNGTTQNTFTNDYLGLNARKTEYAHQNRIGFTYRSNYYFDNATSYGGVSWRLMPVRNTTNAAITRTINFNYSTQDTYNGMGLGYFTPSTTTGTNYANVAGGTWTQVATDTANSAMTSSSASITIPANTTVILMLVTAHQYATTGWFIDSSMFYNLNTFFPMSGDLVCDNRMLNTLATYRDTFTSSNSSSTPQDAYTACATLYGDR